MLDTSGAAATESPRLLPSAIILSASTLDRRFAAKAPCKACEERGPTSTRPLCSVQELDEEGRSCRSPAERGR
jgi:hypothetical protein